MKYSKRLAEQLGSYPPYIRRNCLQYKKWKKDIKTHPYYMTGCWKNKLVRECKKLDTLLYPCQNRQFHFPTCSVVHTEPIDPRIVRELCKINTDTMYKICKRLDKKLGINAFDYYCTLLRRNVFNFTHVSHETLVD